MQHDKDKAFGSSGVSGGGDADLKINENKSDKPNNLSNDEDNNWANFDSFNELT